MPIDQTLPRIFITPGEPAGIGVDVVIEIAAKTWQAELIVVADPDLLLTRAAILGKKLALRTFDQHASAQLHRPYQLKIFPIPLQAPVIPGQLNKDNAQYVWQTLEAAAKLCLQNPLQAIATGPVHKAIMQEADLPFTGHTEFFAQLTHSSQSVMLFVVDQLKIALATTHLPLRDVPKSLTQNHLKNVLRVLEAGLIQQFQIQNPKIKVCGLNPHAGEAGHLGREEVDVIEPVLAELQQEGMQVTGPFPADTIFTPHHLKDADAILAMYHDQALPLVKYLGFGHAVNVTLGLPFIRTSVDHGTALDLAGKGKADPSSMEAALNLAISLLNR